MNVFEISYDLHKPGQNYGALYDEIKRLGSWWHCLDSTWLVKSSMQAVTIRDRLAPHLDGNDSLLVGQLSGEAAWQGFGGDCSSWLKEALASTSRALA